MDKTNCVTNLIDHYPDWEGAKVLQLLIQHANTDIYATVVELCLESTIPPLEAQNLRYHLAPIKMTDEATLRAVDKRLNALIAQKANLQTSRPLNFLIPKLTPWLPIAGKPPAPQALSNASTTKIPKHTNARQKPSAICLPKPPRTDTTKPLP